MAKLINEIAGMSEDGQKFVLENMEKELVPLSIDGVLYMIPREVSELIEMLVSDCNERIQNKQDIPQGFR